MSVLIKGMEMPIKCGLCPCFHAEWPMYCQAVKADKNKRIIAPYGLPRPEWCPLIELPAQHGRLIDVDELKSWVENYFEMNRYYHPHSKSTNIPAEELYDILAQVPAVVEAEVDG